MRLDIHRGQAFFEELEGELVPVHRDDWQEVYLLRWTSDGGER